MATYVVTGPDGREYEMTVPDDATPEFVRQKAMLLKTKLMPESSPPEAEATKPSAPVAQVQTEEDPSAFSQALSNVPSSAGQFFKDLAQPILHPVETAKSLGTLASGAYNKVIDAPVSDIPGYQAPESVAVADAVSDYYANRYGGIENLKNTAIQDPVGAMADAAGLLSVPSMAARAPGLLGKAGNIAGKASAAIDPLNIATKSAAVAGKYPASFASYLLGNTTGVGSDAIKQAASAAVAGGERAQDFTGAMRGSSDIDKLLSDARSSLAAMKEAKHSEYLKNQAEFKAVDYAMRNSASVPNGGMSMSPIKKKLDEIEKSFKDSTGNQFVVGDNAQRKLNDLKKIVADWDADPNLHTVSGFDALKRRIDDEMPSFNDNNKQGIRAVTDLRNEIKKQLVEKVPSYAEAMKEYEKASALEQEIEKALSLGKKSSKDTALRKLQSVMRNNVNTSYGYRQDLVKKLEEAGNRNLLDQAAGQSLSAKMPRGLQGLLPGAGLGLGIGLGGLSTALPYLGLTSPRLVGEAAYLSGKSMKPVAQLNQLSPAGRALLSQGLLQSGRINQQAGLLGR